MPRKDGVVETYLDIGDIDHVILVAFESNRLDFVPVVNCFYRTLTNHCNVVSEMRNLDRHLANLFIHIWGTYISDNVGRDGRRRNDHEA